MSFWVVLLAASSMGSLECELPAPSDKPDEALARLYEEVGTEELGRENFAAAAAAFREALRLNRSREGLSPLFLRACAQAQGHGLPWAISAVKNEGCAAALPVLAAYSSAGEPSAQLVHGICLFEAGQDKAAMPLLEAAARFPDFAQHARLFLGLAASRLGERSRAISELELAQGGSAGELRTAATRLLRSTRRRGVFSFFASAHAGVDTNVDLAPLGSAATADAADGFGLFRAAAELRPYREASGPFLLVSGSLRKQATFTAFDAFGGAGNAGYVFVSRRVRGSFDYGLESLFLSSSPYATKHSLNAAVTYFTEVLWVTMTYRPSLSAFSPPSVRSWSGTRHSGALDVGFSPATWLNLWTGYRAARELTATPVYSSTMHGPMAGLGARPFEDLQLLVRAQLEWRSFDERDPAFPVRREDVALDVAAGAEYRLSSYVALNVDLTYRQVESTLPALTHRQMLATVGLSVAGGVL